MIEARETNGLVTIGVDYYTNLIREHAIMEEQIDQCRALLIKETEENSRMMYVKDVAKIFKINLNTYQE